MQPDTPPSTAEPAATAALRLPPSLDLTWADTLHAELQGRLGRDAALHIDGSEVERVSTACLQLLVAAAAGAAAHGLEFHIAGSSRVLGDAVRDLGLGAALGMEAE